MERRTTTSVDRPVARRVAVPGLLLALAAMAGPAGAQTGAGQVANAAPSSVAAQPATDAPAGDAAQGKRLYSSYCARCHGVNMVSSGNSFDLRTFPADQKQRFLASVTNGLRAMPAWGGKLEPGEMESLWAFITTNR